MLTRLDAAQVTSTARPFMGPNLYVTPPAAFTHFHQDGHGTVDSGHLCLRGYNEVVILRRLTERHKQHSLMILTGNLGGNKKQKSFPTYFDGLYQEPHGDLLVSGNKTLFDCSSRSKASQSIHLLAGRETIMAHRGAD